MFTFLAITTALVAIAPFARKLADLANPAPTYAPTARTFNECRTLATYSAGDWSFA